MPVRNGIELTQCGQPWPYASAIHAGSVLAATEAEARKQLAAMRGVTEILDRQDAVQWSRPYFTDFAQVQPGKWRFRIVTQYAG